MDSAEADRIMSMCETLDGCAEVMREISAESAEFRAEIARFNDFLDTLEMFKVGSETQATA